MGRRMAQEKDFHPQKNHNTRKLSSWLTLQSTQTESNISPSDTTHFAQHGTFPPRTVLPSTPVTLRLEIHDASTSHLPSGIRRPYHDIHPLTAQTLADLLAMLRRQVRHGSPLEDSNHANPPNV